MSFRPPCPLNASELRTTQDWTAWLASTGAIASVRNTDESLCGMCARPMAPDRNGRVWPRCWLCNTEFRHYLNAVVPISFSASGGLTSLIAQAKDESETRWWVKFGLASLLATWLTTHLLCLERLAHGPFDYVAVVPSHPTRRAGVDHLKGLVSTVAAGAWPTLNWDLDLLTKLKPSIADDRRRQVDLDLFEVVPGRQLAGRRVLLIDDLFTTGSTLAAAGAALTAAGASPPVAVTIGRQLGRGDQAAIAFLNATDLSTRGYEADTCRVHIEATGGDDWWSQGR